MEDRLATALNSVIKNSHDGRLKEILSAVLDLKDEVEKRDDWSNYVKTKEFADDMLSWF